MSEDKESLVAQVEELRSQLLPQLARDREVAQAEGRRFSTEGWLSGGPTQHKYPSGPGFLPKGTAQEVTAWTGVANMDSGDWFRVALGSAALYVAGFGSGE